MAEERQTNYTIGEAVELPSKGLIYSKKINPQIELRSMTARDEMKRQNPSASQFKVMADIIENCMIEKPAIHVYDMALGDYEFLLHKLRIITYGDSYKISLYCPYCKEQINTETHLESLKVKDFDINLFNSTREITLPVSGKIVTLKFQTPRMLDELEAKTREMKRKFPAVEISFEMLVLLLSVIDTIDGEKYDQARLETFINALPAKDMAKIINSVDALNAMIGIDNTLFVDCPSCGGEVRTSFRYGPEFFRPTNI
ncbi:MAG: hypothetical protein J6Z11_05605 [Candidatus Riflebacteria bacterium]|nr:hypothetical protein [Candidatus Riflebacteria bacterium]